jgi:hypothetical protein
MLTSHLMPRKFFPILTKPMKHSLTLTSDKYMMQLGCHQMISKITLSKVEVLVSIRLVLLSAEPKPRLT